MFCFLILESSFWLRYGLTLDSGLQVVALRCERLGVFRGFWTDLCWGPWLRGLRLISAGFRVAGLVVRVDGIGLWLRWFLPKDWKFDFC